MSLEATQMVDCGMMENWIGFFSSEHSIFKKFTSHLVGAFIITPAKDCFLMPNKNRILLRFSIGKQKTDDLARQSSSAFRSRLSIRDR
jgi:hypothetical protein